MLQLTSTQDFAAKMSHKTNPYQSGNYAGDVSHSEWLEYSIFTLYTYAYNIAGELEESNCKTIKTGLSENTAFDGFWADERIQSWVTPFYRVTIYPYGIEFDQPFNDELVSLCQDIVNQLADYPVLDEDDYSQRQYDAFWNCVRDDLSGYEESDPIFTIVENRFHAFSGDYDAFLNDELPEIIKEYERQSALENAYNETFPEIEALLDAFSDCCPDEIRAIDKRATMGESVTLPADLLRDLFSRLDDLLEIE